MNIKKIKEKRLSALGNAYNELVKVLDNKLDVNQVDPEKLKISAAVYKQAAEDSDFILKQILSILEDDEVIEVKKDKKKSTGGLSPESRIKR